MLSQRLKTRFLRSAPTHNRPPDSRPPTNADSDRPNHSLTCIFWSRQMISSSDAKYVVWATGSVVMNKLFETCGSSGRLGIVKYYIFAGDVFVFGRWIALLSPVFVLLAAGMFWATFLFLRRPAGTSSFFNEYYVIQHSSMKVKMVVCVLKLRLQRQIFCSLWSS